MQIPTCRVIALHVENVKRLVAVDIRPTGNTVTLTGKNGAGKSSVLDAIAYALGGAALLPEEPMRRGTSHAVVRVDLGELRVERKWTESGGSTLTVTAADGTRCPSPQAILDALVGKLTFDPTEFCRMKPQARAEILLRLLGIGDQLAQLKARHDNLYAERTDCNRELKQVESALALADHAGPTEDPGLPVDVAALMAECRRLETGNRMHTEARAELVRLREQAGRHAAMVQRVRETIATIERQLASAREDLAEQERHASLATAQVVTCTSQVEALIDADLGPIQDQILGAEKHNTAVRLWSERQQRTSARDAKLREVARVTHQLDQAAEEKRSLIAGATFPVPGLTADLDGVYLDGVPFGQGSQAQQLAASLEVGWALNPALKVMMVRDASLLDDDSLDAVRASAEAHDGQLWLERVKADEGEAAILIEAGLVAAAPAEVGQVAIGRAALEVPRPKR